MVQVGLVWFGQNSEAEFNTVSESLTKVGIELLGQLKTPCTSCPNFMNGLTNKCIPDPRVYLVDIFTSILPNKTVFLLCILSIF